MKSRYHRPHEVQTKVRAVRAWSYTAYAVGVDYGVCAGDVLSHALKPAGPGAAAAFAAHVCHLPRAQPLAASLRHVTDGRVLMAREGAAVPVSESTWRDSSRAHHQRLLLWRQQSQLTKAILEYVILAVVSLSPRTSGA